VGLRAPVLTALSDPATAFSSAPIPNTTICVPWSRFRSWTDPPVAEIFSSISDILTNIPTVVHVLATVPSVFQAIARPPVMPPVVDILGPVTNILAAITHILPAVADILDTVMDILVPVTKLLVSLLMHALADLGRNVFRQAFKAFMEPLVVVFKTFMSALMEPLSPSGMVLDEPLVGFGVILLQPLERRLSMCLAPLQQFLVPLRVSLLQFTQALFDPPMALRKPLAKGLRIVFFHPFQAPLPAFLELLHRLLVGLRVGLFQMRQPLPEPGFPFLDVLPKCFRIFCFELPEPLRFLSDPFALIFPTIPPILT